MKKLVVLGSLVFAGLVLFSSCKKDWTCECNVLGTTIPIIIEDSTKKDAKAECEDDTNGACKLK
jgi:hypothetical protein